MICEKCNNLVVYTEKAGELSELKYCILLRKNVCNIVKCSKFTEEEIKEEEIKEEDILKEEVVENEPERKSIFKRIF
jgi:hypothetical protein